ncbi:MAG: cob(I)yrinic acid a,c-diamide adenosyltransferase [Lentisphaeria bacterium]|nr:cob(I)yrinic acid a,c-diamide adenosyltransferase [Lentisphaeria bacterium]
MIQIYTGDGKGKTTASTGLTVRALGAGLRVFFAQFIKNGSSSEIRFLKEHGGENFTYFTRGSGRFIIGDPPPEECSRAAETLNALKDALSSGRYDLIVADEILGSLQARLFTSDDLRILLDTANANPEVELILTGRNAPDFAVERAGLVSEIKCVKHYYTQGRPPKKGIEF